MSNDASNIARLQSEHLKAINQSTFEEGKWESIKKEYEDLKETLSTLPQKLEHNVMIPVGLVGLFPGKLIHTNEITVLLGDNWFVQRSAYQACDIVNHRLELVKQKLLDARNEKEFIESRKKLTEDLSQFDRGEGDIREIVETDEGPVKKGKRRIAHKSSHNVIPRQVKKFEDVTSDKQKIHQVANFGLSSALGDTDVDQLFARLDQLEIEERNNELTEYDNISDNNTKELVNRVHFEDDVTKQDLDNNSVNIGLDSTAENCIKFNHTRRNSNEQEVAVKQTGDEQHEQNINGGGHEMFQSPADIYKLFAKSVESEEKPLKSILKKERKHSNEDLKPRPILKHSPEHKVETSIGDEVISLSVEERKPILKSGSEAVTATVVEKKIDVQAPKVDEVAPKKPVSRFKASRMKK